MGYTLLLIISVAQGIRLVLTKKFSSDTKHIKNAMNVYMLIIHPLAALYYFILAGGNTPLNWPTFWFSLIFGLVGVGVTGFNMIGYRYASLIYISVFSGAGATVIPFLFELLLGREFFSVPEILSVILRLAAVCIPLLGIKKGGKSTKTGFLICALLFFLSGAVNIVYKLYGEYPGVHSDESFCFWTNVVVLPFIVAMVFKQAGFRSLLASAKKIKPVDYVCVIASMIIGNFCGLISIEALRMLSATVYSIVNSSLVLVITVIISMTLYKEKLKKETAISVLLSILAIVLSFV